MSGLETILWTFRFSPVPPCIIITYGKAQAQRHLARSFIIDYKLKAYESSLQTYLGLAQSFNLKLVYKSGFPVSLKKIKRQAQRAHLLS